MTTILFRQKAHKLMQPSRLRQKTGFTQFLCVQSNTSIKMDNCEVKVGELTHTVATKNVTISALVALFIIHNAQTCWLPGLSGTYVLQMKMDRFLNWKVSA